MQIKVAPDRVNIVSAPHEPLVAALAIGVLVLTEQFKDLVPNAQAVRFTIADTEHPELLATSVIDIVLASILIDQDEVLCRAVEGLGDLRRYLRTTLNGMGLRQVLGLPQEVRLERLDDPEALRILNQVNLALQIRHLLEGLPEPANHPLH